MTTGTGMLVYLRQRFIVLMAPRSEFVDAVAKEFPGIQIAHRNKGQPQLDISQEFSGKQGQDLARLVQERVKVYFDKHGYGLSFG